MSVRGRARLPLNLRSVWVVARKEFLDNVRNRWVVAISGVFVVLALVVSYFGAAQAQGRTGFRGLGATVLGMQNLQGLLVPILALMLGYGAVVGEKEQGSMLLLLAMPISRLEAMVGKFLGLGSVLAVALASGLGAAGAVIAAAAGAEGLGSYLVFVLGSLLFALAFLSVGLLASTVAKKRSTAIGLAILLWFFFVVIFDTILIGAYVAGGGTFTPGSRSLDLPDWYHAIAMGNPRDAFGMFAQLAFGTTEVFGVSVRLPGFVTLGGTALSMLAWTAIPLALAIWMFQRQDV